MCIKFRNGYLQYKMILLTGDIIVQSSSKQIYHNAITKYENIKFIILIANSNYIKLHDINNYYYYILLQFKETVDLTNPKRSIR